MCDLRALGMYKKTFTLNENKNMILGNGDQPVFFKVWSGIITGIVDSEKKITISFIYPLRHLPPLPP